VGVDLFEAQPLLRDALAANGNGSGAAMVELQETPMALAYASLPNPAWKLAVIAPLDDLTQSVAVVRAAIGRNAERTLQLTTAIIALCFTLALLGIVLLSRHWLTQPIAALVAATEAVGRGAAAITIPHTRRDEIGMLFSAFNRMTAELAASRRQLETRVAERTGELSALLRIGQRVALASDIDSTLNTLAQSVVEGARAEACAITVLDADAPQGYSVTPFGLPEGYIEIGDSIPDPEEEYNLWAQAMKTQQPVIMRDVRATVLAQPEHAPMHPLMRRVAWDTVVCVPLTYQNRGLGTLTIYYRPEQEIGEQQMAFLRAVADQATMAVENARLFRQARESAAVLERQKLARELHDSVSQALYGIALGAQTARAHLEQRPEAAIQPLEYVLSLAKAGMTEMRALIFELRPESLEQEGLVAALTKQADVLRMRYHIEVEVVTDAEPPLSLKRKEALYRVAQEALHNIVKHAEATQVQISLQQQDGEVELFIRDNGVGFDTGGNFPGHLGLVSMRERVEKVGGAFVLTSTQGEGSCVLARVRVEES
jgi:signal transduction histidine kinase